MTQSKINPNSAYNLIEAVLTNDHDSAWQKYQSILDTNESDSVKLNGILSYMVGSDGELTGAGKKFKQAYEDGYSLNELVAYKALQSAYSKKADIISHAEEYGLSRANAARLYSRLS